MSYEFMGQQFTSAKVWARAFPAYSRHFWKYVTAGATTPTEIEQMAYEATKAGNRKRDGVPNPMKSGITGLATRRKL